MWRRSQVSSQFFRFVALSALRRLVKMLRARRRCVATACHPCFATVCHPVGHYCRMKPMRLAHPTTGRHSRVAPHELNRSWHRVQVWPYKQYFGTVFRPRACTEQPPCRYKCVWLPIPAPARQVHVHSTAGWAALSAVDEIFVSNCSVQGADPGRLV